MAVKWSWAFGQETPTQLKADMDFNFLNTSQSNVNSTITYTYAGSPTRYSMGCDGGAEFTLPTASFPVTGWIATAVYFNATAYAAYAYLIKCKSQSGKFIAIYNESTLGPTMGLYVDNALKETFAAPSFNDWHYFALKYDMSVTNAWTGRVYINGSAVTSSWTDTSATAATSGSCVLEGCTNLNESTIFAQIIIYDSLGDAGETPLFVTRLPPNADTGEVGTWVPSTGATNIGVTNNDPLNIATYTQEAAPTSGDNVVTEVNNLVTQLGLTAGTVLGATNHTYSSGTNVQVFASIRDSGGTYVNGATITPDSADTTYGFGTATAGLTGSSTIQCKYEVV
mgnify:FL=1